MDSIGPQLLTVLVVLSIVASAFVSFVIVKFDRLRKDVTNILLLNVNIVEMLFLSLSLIAWWFFAIHSRDGEIICYEKVTEVPPALAFCIFLLLMLLTTDGCIKTCNGNSKHTNFHRICNYLFLAVIYGLTIAFGCVMPLYCSRSESTNLFIQALLLMLAILSLGVVPVFVIVMNVIHGVVVCCSTARLPNNNIGLAITNIFMLAWLTLYPAILVGIYANESKLFMGLIWVAMTTCSAIPIFNLIYLCRCDNFNVFLAKAFRCDWSDDQNESPRNASVAYYNADSVLIAEQTHDT